MQLVYETKNIDKWDITVISCLLNYFYDILPQTKSHQDLYNKIRKQRNKLYAHVGKYGFKMTDCEFKKQWSKVVQVLRNFASLINLREFNIEMTIKNIEMENVVNGDVLKEMLETWMRKDEILGYMRKDIDGLKESMEETKQELVEIKQRIPNPGTKAGTDFPVRCQWMPNWMKTIIQILFSAFWWISSRTKPVNEPVDSSCGCEQMPSKLKVGYIDCIILHAPADKADATKLKEYLNTDIPIEKHGPVDARLYNDPDLRLLSGSEIGYLNSVYERSTYILLFMTKAFVEDKWEQFKSESCIMDTIFNKKKQWSVLPVYPQDGKSEPFQIPLGINALKGIHFRNTTDEFFRSSMKRLIEDKVHVRVEANDKLKTQQNAWRRKQNSADLKEDTDRLHDDEINKKDEAPASQAVTNTEQKKKKKKRKKNRR